MCCNFQKSAQTVTKLVWGAVEIVTKLSVNSGNPSSHDSYKNLYPDLEKQSSILFLWSLNTATSVDHMCDCH